MTKILKAFSFIVIALFSLSIFGWMSTHVAKGDKKFGFLTETIKFMYSFPDMFNKSVEEAKTFALPKTFVKTPKDFQALNELDTNLTVLTVYSDTGNLRTVDLMNLKDNTVLYRWKLKTNKEAHNRVFNPLLLPGKRIAYSFENSPFICIDSLGNEVWKQDSIWPHHSKNLDSNGDIWVCTYPNAWGGAGSYTLNDKPVLYKDEYLTKVDAETGHILFHKSISEILVENGLSNYLLKSGNIWDPLHSNDIEPALTTTEFYNEGDIFISFKNLSALLHYRPETNELIDVIEGPFNCQHDIDFMGDTSLVFFNNNIYQVNNGDYRNANRIEDKMVFAGDLYSNIVQYDFDTENFSFLLDSVMSANKIYTGSEGLIDFFGSGYCLIEQQNSGVLWIVKDNKVVYKNVLKSFHDGFHHLPNWTRIIKEYE